MPETQPTLDEWRALYAAADQIKALAPWEWMFENQVFGVQDPLDHTLGFISVMGTLGEHFAVAVYLGSKGLSGFMAMQNAGPNISPEMVLEVPQLQASFESRDDLEKEDREVMKQLGLKYRGANNWPMFRSYRPGFFPWMINADEARLLTLALQQLLDVAPRLRQNPGMIHQAGSANFLIRKARQESGRFVWEDHFEPLPPPAPTEIPIPIEKHHLDALEGARIIENVLQVDLFMLPMPTREKGERPYFPYQLLIVDKDSGYILHQDLFPPEPTLEAMWGQVIVRMVEFFGAQKVIPGQIEISSDLLMQLFQPLTKELDIKLKQKKKLPALERAKKEMLQWVGNFG